ncbi:MAG: MBL fold metallo-hydrolase [Candidatus Binatia bacterium]|nr:MBL fold metallo-hydrolase [Candidatus Binatia bacterium]
MLDLGRFRVHLVSDGRFAMDGGAMFGIVPKPLWQRHVPFDDQNRIDMSLHCPLAENGKEAILIDTGLGDRLSEKEHMLYRVDRQGGLRARLAELKIDPEEVTHVVLTHLHFDHLGGAVVRNGAGHLVPAFPRAKHFVQRAELDTALHPTDARTAGAYGHATECLAPLQSAGLIEPLEGETDITPQLRVLVTGGHTPSHQCPVLSDGGSSFVHLGDVAPTRAHLRPAWNAAYDLDPLETMDAKNRLLTRAAEGEWWVSFDHDHEIACGRLSENWAKTGELDDSRPL